MIRSAKHTSSLFLGMITALLSFQTAFSGRTFALKPIDGKAVSVSVDGKNLNYYLLSKTHPLKLKVDGPVKVKIQTRLSIPAAHSIIEKYSIKVTEKGGVIKLQSTSTERSDASYHNSKFIPGKIRKFTLAVPEGSHMYEFSLENTNLTEAVLKFSSISKGKTENKGRITLEPLSYEKVVTAFVKENIITYYVSSKENNVQLHIIGPTRLQVISRLNFDATMKGSQTYALAIYEKGNRVLLEPLSTTKSLGISYTEWKIVVPGKTNKVFLDVPRGEHTYAFVLEETAAHSVSMTFSIPKKDLDNEE
jgi:hypothetical protein